MKKSAVLLIMLGLSILASSAYSVQAVQAAYTPDGEGFPLCGEIDINSPRNTTYPYSSFTSSVSVRTMLYPQIYTYDLVYSLDGEDNLTIPVTPTFVPVIATRTYANGTTEKVVSQFASYYLLSGNISLPQLPIGSHNLTVYGRYSRFNDANTNWPKLLLDRSIVEFLVSEETPPNQTVTEPPVKSNNRTVSDAATIMSLPQSETSVDASQSTTTGQTPTASVLLMASIITGIIVVAVASVVKRRRKIDKLASFSAQEISA